MDSQAEKDRRLLRVLWVRAYLPNFLFATGQGAIVPVLAIAAKHLGATTSLAAFIVALNGLGTMFTDIPAGWIIRRLGERRSTLVATVLLLIGLTVCYLAHSVEILGIGIYVQASGWAIWSLVRLTNISRISSVTTRGRAISIFGGVSRAGQVVGPFIVAAFATASSVRISFVVYFLCAAVGWVWLESAREGSQRRGSDAADASWTQTSGNRKRPPSRVRDGRRYQLCARYLAFESPGGSSALGRAHRS